MLRLNPEEYESLRNRINASIAPKTQMREPMRQHRNKYGNEITLYQGIRFDSKAECKRYVQLQAMEKAGQISDLKVQVSFDLLPAQEIDGKRERPVRYVADFTYIEKGKLVVEDVKSGPTKTVEYRLKKKLMLYFHRIAIREVMMS